MYQPTDLISTSEARHILNVSAVKMAQLIRHNIVRHFPNQLDKRMKLVSKAEIEALKPKRAEAA